MAIVDLEYELERCQEHLINTKSANSQIDFFLTQFMLIRICGEYEQEIKRLINERIEKTGDHNLTSFLKNMIRVRSLKFSELLGNIIVPLCSDQGKKFKRQTSDSEARTRYDNIIENRNLVAHGTSVHMTFDELKASYDFAKTIMVEISEALSHHS